MRINKILVLAVATAISVLSFAARPLDFRSMKPDYYIRLGLKPDATKAEIKRAYQKLASRWHPDRHPNQKELAEEKFKSFKEAYDILKDEDSRSQYDQIHRFKSNNFHERSDAETRDPNNPLQREKILRELGDLLNEYLVSRYESPEDYADLDPDFDLGVMEDYTQKQMIFNLRRNGEQLLPTDMGLWFSMYVIDQIDFIDPHRQANEDTRYVIGISAIRWLRRFREGIYQPNIQREAIARLENIQTALNERLSNQKNQEGSSRKLFEKLWIELTGTPHSQNTRLLPNGFGDCETILNIADEAL